MEPAAISPALQNRPPRGKARAHSLFVRFLRIALPIVMIAVVATLAGLVIDHALKRRAAARKDEVTPIRMINPHFFGRDNQGKAFTLGARQAARDDKSFQRVLLEFPTLTLDSGGPDPSHVTADEGVYHEDTRLLYLSGHVKADNYKNSKLATDEALVNTRTGAVTSPSALTSQTSTGQMNSNGFDVFDKGDRMIFKGRVHSRLNAH
jgi:lipopolysaccharide export system protein LptC